ncbi:glycoside hydrolase, partial [Aspergillus japonicus CBS 114.51]
MRTYLLGNCQKSTIFAFSEVDKVAAGIYIGGSLQHAHNIDAIMDDVADLLQTSQIYDSGVWQYCGINSNRTLGLAVDLNGDLAAVQQYVRTWSDGKCVSGFTTTQTGSAELALTNTLLSNSSQSGISHTHSVLHAHRRSTCSYVQVVSGDSCASLVEECGITSDEFYDYNTASDLCSTLAVGQYVCCSSGTLPDFAPSPYANGTCYTYDVVSGDSCSVLAATYSITEDDIEDFNSDTWAWYGCDNLQAGQSICLSDGNAPLPIAITNAVCGPQVPGTNFTGATDAAAWALLNPCPVNACCDTYGQCGATPDYCNDTLAATGAPGTAAAGSYGCISNCGTDIVNTATAPSSYSAVGYFEATSVDRPCLQMNGFSISPQQYTHVHFAFGNITSTYSVSIAGAEQQFTYFQELEGMKRIISFGGWDFSTSPDTYMIFREAVTADNRDTLVQNVVDFLDQYDLDGVDFDWEYPGEPDIPGIPAGSDEDGSNYLAFLTALRAALPSKSISISAPASYWYLKAFPIAEIAEVVDYIVFMAYDLHGTWDLGDDSAQSGCAAGDCLFNHVNLTETMWALSMISKAPVATSSIMVGVASYGRSFEMTTAGCYSSSCTWSAGGAAGPCTQTTGYISNAEINQILAENSDAQWIFDSASDSDILVYNDTQWVGYMTNTTKSTRTAYYQTYNFAGTSEWAIDLEEFE